jgi:hypothetical protein
MSINATTLSGAITANQTSFGVASTTGITAPNFQTGAGITFLLIDQEFMLVNAVNTTSLVVTVARGQFGTAATAHVSGTLVQAGLPTDFQTNFNEAFQSVLNTQETLGAQKKNTVFLTGSADALTGAPGIFLVKTAGVDAITLPTATAAMEGNVIEVWSDTTNAHTITCATTTVAAGQALKTTITFPAFRGAGVVLRAANGSWQIVGNGGVAAAGSVTLS